MLQGRPRGFRWAGYVGPRARSRGASCSSCRGGQLALRTSAYMARRAPVSRGNGGDGSWLGARLVLVACRRWTPMTHALALPGSAAVSDRQAPCEDRYVGLSLAGPSDESGVLPR
jgi:hypothetical protein